MPISVVYPPLARMTPTTPATQFTRTPNLELRFPPLPRTVAEVSLLLADSGDVPDTERLVEIVRADPVVAAFVLRRINSAYYGLRRRIGSLPKAVFLLGFLEICNLVLTVGMMKLKDILASKEQTHIFEQLMRLSMGTAHHAQELALRLRLPDARLAFTIGLLHTVGRLVLLHNKPDDYEALSYTSEENILPSAAAEHAIFGIDHAELAGYVAERWHLPDVMEVPIRHYINPTLAPIEHRPLALVIAAASAATVALHLQGQTAATFEPPEVLLRLAHDFGIPSKELVRLLIEGTESTDLFINSMVKS